VKICLIGSTRFMDRYHEANRKLTLAGHIVYTVAMISSRERGIDGPNISAADKEWLDLVHLVKIQESDAVIVIGCTLDEITGNHSVDTYIGESTRREIRWAALNQKEIFMETGVESICRSKETARYNLNIPGHEDPEWKHDCARDHRKNSLTDILSALTGGKPVEDEDPETRPA
jgi:hypothetical protein